MTTKDQTKDQEKDLAKGTPVPQVDDAPGERIPVGRVKIREDDELADEHSGFFDPETGEEIPVRRTINEVPASDGQGGTVMVPANEPGHADITTSPVEEQTTAEGMADDAARQSNKSDAGRLNEGQREPSRRS